MKELVYTQGEWWIPHFVKNHNDPAGCKCTFVLHEGYCGSIATIGVDNGIKSIADGGNDCPPIEEAIGNAKLICASPKMYKLLIKAQEEILHLKQKYGDAGHGIKTLHEIDELLNELHR